MQSECDIERNINLHYNGLMQDVLRKRVAQKKERKKERKDEPVTGIA